MAFEKRTKAVLLPLIKKHVHAGSVVYSDVWRAYVSEVTTSTGEKRTHSLETVELLKDMSLTHCWVCHDKHFVDPVTGVHTNEIEGVWGIRIKRFCKAMRGVKK